MTKQENLDNPDSCLSRARPLERIFVLLERDDSAPNTIRFWVRERIRTGKNKPTDPEMLTALSEADDMEYSRVEPIHPWE